MGRVIQITAEYDGNRSGPQSS